MKLTTLGMLGLQTSCLRAFVVILGFALVQTNVPAQEPSPVGENEKPLKSPAVPAKPAAAAPVANSKMPDISGTWSTGMGKSTEVAIRRVKDDTADFVIEYPGNGPRLRLRWSRDAQHFETAPLDPSSTGISKLTAKLLADGRTLRVTMSRDERARQLLLEGGHPESAVPLSLNQEWTGTPGRIETQGIVVVETKEGIAFFSKPLGKWNNLKLARPAVDELPLDQTVVSAELATVRSGNALYAYSSRTGRYAKLAIPGDFRGIISPELGSDLVTVRLGDETHVFSANTSEWSSPNSVISASDAEPATLPASTPSPQARGIPTTPEAKRLTEQLQAQESAAAAEAATIRQLQANGQAEQNQPPMAEHQRKLKNLLSTAFDLKLQWEELQVKELQSRLSRLERQIGQRKELREKIITRRATELIEGDVLKWTPDAARSTPGSTITANPAALETPAANVSLRVEATSKLIWEKIGLKFGEPVTAEKFGSQGSKYRGGLPIVEVRGAGSDPKKGIRQGDVLVGLDKWETTSLDVVLWILKQSETQPKSNPVGLSLKFLVVREGETRYGFLQVEGQNAATSKSDPPQPTAKSLDELLTILKNSRSRDEVSRAGWEIAKQCKGADSDRAVSAMLAAADSFHEFNVSDNISAHLADCVSQIDPLWKSPVIVRALREGSDNVKQFALECVDPLKDLTVATEFPELAKHVLTVAAGELPARRITALRILGETLPITQLKPEEFTTDERREMARRLTEFAPHDRVVALLATALSDKQIDVVLEAALALARFTKMDTETLGKLVEVLANVTKGKLDDAKASREQRQFAFDILALLGVRAAPAIPTLIELLKSDDPDIKAIEFKELPIHRSGFGRTRFTRHEIIQIFKKMGPEAKSALPDLEATALILKKKEKEDALLSPNTNRRDTSLSNELEYVIKYDIKKASSPFGRGFGF